MPQRETQSKVAKIERVPDVLLSSSGFPKPKITIFEGQTVNFVWDEKRGDGINVYQVVEVNKSDETVPGGYHSGPQTKECRYSIQFNIAGKFKFGSNGTKNKASTILVEVKERTHYNVTVDDDGFQMKIITLNEGDSINFRWEDCMMPHSIIPLEFCDLHSGFIAKSPRSAMPSVNGSYMHQFKSPGLYYFYTQVSHSPQTSGLCIVQINEVNREYRIQVQERRFEPMILLIEEGDKVWFSWENTKDNHCVYQIEPHSIDQPSADEYKQVKDGFKWHMPTKTGLLAHQFTEPGVFYFTDQDYSFSAEYIGTIIVKPKQREHVIDMHPISYTPQLLHLKTNERVWWQWSPKEMEKAFCLKRVEECISPIEATDKKCQGTCRKMTESQLVQFCQAGVQTTVINSVGLYHFKIPENVHTLPTSSIVAQSGEKNMTIKIDDAGFSQRVITIYPGSRVWFIWQDTQKPHNVVQVSYEGKTIPKGFCSGAPRRGPSAFLHQFNTPGVFYFVSKALPRLFGAIVVSNQPKVHAIAVMAELKPDPLQILKNDVVYWVFNEMKRHDVVQIETLEEAINPPQTRMLPPRLVMNRAFADDGIYHFTSLSMINRARHSSSSSLEPEDFRIGTIIADERNDSHIVRVDSEGFHPRNLLIKKGESVMWTWKESPNEDHNVIHVSPPDSEVPLSIIEGKAAFNSGKPCKNQTYLHTFDEVGYFCVASYGASGYVGAIKVIGTVGEDKKLVKAGVKTCTPYIDYTEQLGGSVERDHVVELKCKTPGATIYFTTDGSIPYPRNPTSKMYDPNEGVKLTCLGFLFIRACAVADDKLDSSVFTSRRYAVTETLDSTSTDRTESDQEETFEEARQKWPACKPQIRVYFLEGEPGEMNVTWDRLDADKIRLVSAYRLLINGVQYALPFPPTCSTVNVAGLSGGQTYGIILECLPKSEMFLPLRSNRVMRACDPQVDGGGPLISLQLSKNADEIVIVWRHVSTATFPVRGYLVYLNKVQCGALIKPKSHETRCKAVIRARLGVEYGVIVVAISVRNNNRRASNELSVKLPLNLQEIVLPPSDQRAPNPELYKEYIEIKEDDSESSATSDAETVIEGEDGSGTETETETETADQTDTATTTPRNSEENQSRHRTSSSLPVVDEAIPSVSQAESEDEEVDEEETSEEETSETETPHRNQKHQEAVSYFVAPPQAQSSQIQRKDNSKKKVNKADERTKISTVATVHNVLTQDSSTSQAPQSQPSTSTQHAVPETHAPVATASQAPVVVLQDPSPGNVVVVSNVQNPSIQKAPKAIDVFAPHAPVQYAVDADGAAQPVQYTTSAAAPPDITNQQIISQVLVVKSDEVAKGTSVESQSIPVAKTHEVAGAVSVESQSIPVAKTHEVSGAVSVESQSIPVAKTHEVAGAVSVESQSIPVAKTHGVAGAVSVEARNVSVGKTEEVARGTPVEPQNTSMVKTEDKSTRRVPVVTQNIPVVKNEEAAREVSTGPQNTPVVRREEIARVVPVAAKKDDETLVHQCTAPERSDIVPTRAEIPVQSDAHDRFLPIRETKVFKTIEVPIDDTDVPVMEDNKVGATEEKTTTFVAPPEDYKLPIPVVHIEHMKDGGELVRWELSDRPDPVYRLTSFAVNVIGEKFTTEVNSNISYECVVNKDDRRVNLIQHVWNVTNDHKTRIYGLTNGSTYRMYVAANWTFLAGSYPIDTQSRSTEFDYTTIGAPRPPVLKVLKTELLNQITVQWTESKEYTIPVAGYKLLLNGKSDYTRDGQPGSQLLPATCTQTTVDKLMPGKSAKVQVIAVTNHPVGDSQPSNPLTVICPVVPDPPIIYNQPSYKKGIVIIGWDAPKQSVAESPGHPANITFYSVYVDGVWHGEIKASHACDENGYQYYLTNLTPGVSYDITVKTIAGQKLPEGDVVYCLCEGNLSNTLPVTCAAPPASPHIYIEGMTPQGIDITWEMPQQYGDAVLSGYQLLKNDTVYGSTIPPEVTSMNIKDISLGEDIKLQIIALTEHPVGGTGGAVATAAEGRYAECKPGPQLTLQYSGLVSPVSKVWTEKVTGHQILVVWKHKSSRTKAHYLPADSYQVTWWPGDIAEGHINSCSTTADHLILDDLVPNTIYTIIVEARRKQIYKALDEMGGDTGEVIDRQFIISAKSDKLVVRTGQPPLSVSNLGILASTCHSLQVGWDPPRERGVEVKLIRVDCVPVQKKIKGHICEELLPSETVISLYNLCEHTEYDIIITAVTEEFFDALPTGHEWKKDRQIPKDVKELPDSEWLPKSTITVRTSGTEPPQDLTIKKVTDTSAELTWNPAVVFGNNRLLSYVVRWTRLDPSAEKEKELYMDHINLHKLETSATINNLVPGFQYKIIVEAVVSVKTAIEAIDGDEEKNRRTTHIPSMPLRVRARAPVRPPTVLVTGYTPHTVHLYWDKPVLCSAVARDADGKPVYIKRYLEGYRLYVNGKHHMRLDNSAQSVTLTKCKPGKNYEISLVALTSSEAARREKKRGIRPEEDSDESLSEPISVSLPSIGSGNFDNINAVYVEDSDKDIGSIQVKWAVQSHYNDVKQWNVIWCEKQDGALHKTGVDPERHICMIPVDIRKRIYEISVEPEIYGDGPQRPPTQRIQVVIPGPVDPPEIFLRSVNEKDFTIEWGEPRCYGGVRVKGYQLYLNDKKVGKLLSSTHRKAVIPCRPNRQYKVYMYAIGSEYGDSSNSNSLLINTPGSRFTAGELLDSNIVDFESWEASDQTDLKIRSSQVTDTTMKVDWSFESKPKGVKCYKVIWSCSTQPKDREVRVDTSEAQYSVVLQKLFPGITHYVKVYALGESDIVLEKSKQIIVQTSAPPDTPVVGVRACNLKYIAIQWQKPRCYGNAHLTGYRVYIDGICEAVNTPEQLTYNYTTGKFCTEYSFQVQAITDNDLTSKPSDPLLVRWPGVIPPTIRQLPSETNSSLKLGWDIPYHTEGLRLKHYKVVCQESKTQKIVQTVSPIHPETTQAELYHIRKGLYQVFLEIHLHGTSDIFRSDPIQVEPFIFPDPPVITVSVVDLERRKQLEKVTCDLINKRYKLLSVLTSGNNQSIVPGYKFKRTDLVHAQAKAKDYLIRIDEMLDDCFESLSKHTGVLMLHVSWTNEQSSKDVTINGYRVLVDGKQFGTTLHSAVDNIKIKLNLESSVHRISMVTISGSPYGVSSESNVVDVLTDPFRPYASFCYGNLHQKDAVWPSPGCCRFDASLDYERQQSRLKTINKGLVPKQMAPPKVNVLDVFDCEFFPLLPVDCLEKPVILLFWTNWCLASEKMMEYMFKFSQFNNHKYDFISLVCGLDVTIPEDRQAVVHCITKNGWYDRQAMWHVTDQSASTVVAAQTFIRQNLLGKETKRQKLPEDGPEIAFGNTSDLFGLVGVPSIVIVHPSNYIAWMGTFCAYDQESFDVFIEHTMSECLNTVCKVSSCQQCQANADLYGVLSPHSDVGQLKGRRSSPPTVIPSASSQQGPEYSQPRQRSKSAKRRCRPRSASNSSKGSKSSISVTKRPYSATNAVSNQPIRLPTQS